jgi:hypothetical protein
VTGPVERYLRELERALPRTSLARRRLLREVEEHLREAAREHGDEAAVAAFGDARELGRRFAPQAAARLAALAVLMLLAFPVLTYPAYENNLPPAPWPAAAMPGHLEWKRDAVVVLLLVAVGAAAAALPSLRRGGGGLLGPLAVALGAAGVASVLGVVLTVEWAEAVPGTPSWLILVAAGQLAVAAAAAVLLGRALLLAREERAVGV